MTDMQGFEITGLDVAVSAGAMLAWLERQLMELKWQPRRVAQWLCDRKKKSDRDQKIVRSVHVASLLQL